MVKKFLMLEWRAFFRSASFATNLAMKILMGFLAFIFILYFLGAGIGLYYILKTELNVEPLQTVNQFMIYYLVTDLLFRMFMQKAARCQPQALAADEHQAEYDCPLRPGQNRHFIF